MSRIIAVVGATGKQGGGVVDALLTSKNEWKVRALTRDPESEQAVALKKRGVEVVKADLNNQQEVEQAFKGVYGVFLMTTFHNAGGTELEEKLGKKTVDIAKASNISHVIFSSEEDVEKITEGKFSVPHFTSKARVAEYLKISGIPFTNVQMGFYYDNMGQYYMPKPNSEGVYQFTICCKPDSKIPMVSSKDLGKVAEKIFSNKEQYLGKTIPVVGDYLTVTELADTLAKVWGKQVKAISIPTEVYAKFYFGAKILADMFAWLENFGYFGEKLIDKDIFEAKKIAPEIRTFEQFVKEFLPQPPEYKATFL